MKRCLLAFIFFSISFFVFSQEKKDSLVNLEKKKMISPIPDDGLFVCGGVGPSFYTRMKSEGRELAANIDVAYRFNSNIICAEGFGVFSFFNEGKIGQNEYSAGCLSLMYGRCYYEETRLFSFSVGPSYLILESTLDYQKQLTIAANAKALFIGGSSGQGLGINYSVVMDRKFNLLNIITFNIAFGE